MDANSLTAALVRRVREGELQPDEAEAEAEKLGCGPLASRPPAEEFDPMQLDDWSLPMALAWIAWRSPDEVREWWDEYLRRCLRWRPHSSEAGAAGNGDPDAVWWSLEPEEPVTVCWLRNVGLFREAEGDETAPTKPIKQSMDELWRMLRRGSVRATGVDCHTGERIDIPSVEWLDLEATDENGRDVLRAMTRFPDGPRFSEVRLEAESIRQLWLPRAAAQYSDVQLIAPEGDGYMPLFCAAHWIATRGGAEIVVPDPDSWRSAYGALLGKIVAGKIEIIGTSNGGPPALIEGRVFADCQTAYPFEEIEDELLLKEELVLVSRPCIDDEHWRSGFDDSLRNCKGASWTRIRVRKADVAAVWWFDTPPVEHDSLTHSGFAGRPTSKHIIEAEFSRRCESGEAYLVLAHEASLLRAWQIEKHPQLPAPSEKTIKNNIRAAHHDYRARQEGLK